MFSKSTKTNTSIDSTRINLIGAGTQLVGEVKANGDFRIDGSLKGSIQVNGKLVVGPAGSIEGEIECQNAEILGEVKGKISVSELLSLKASAKLNGEIITNKISIDADAQFNGSCEMGGLVKNLQDSHVGRSEKTKSAAAV